MDLDVVFLGTGGSVPTAARATPATLIRAGGDRLMIDCGEGTQRQMQRSTGLVAVDEILITHYHADHYLGVPGLLKTYDLVGREAPLRVSGPRGLEELFGSLRRIMGRVAYPLVLNELEPGSALELEGYDVHAFEVSHRPDAPALGYAFVEHERPGRLDVELARQLGVPEGPELGRLKAGETIVVDGREVTPERVVGEPRPGRKLVFTGDTRPCDMTRLAAHQAQLLVHDASFAEQDAERARLTGHSTGAEAGRLAREAEVELLAIVHVSHRYPVPLVRDEARVELPGAIAPRDFDTVVVPFPERGRPEHVERGARPPAPARAAAD